MSSIEGYKNFEDYYDKTVWVEKHSDMLSSLYWAMMSYISTYSYPFFKDMSFDAFCDMVYKHSTLQNV
jgi:hypothetical protein